MSSDIGTSFGRLRPPPRLLWTSLALFALLVSLYSVLVEGALLLGVLVVSFVVLWTGVGWLLYAVARRLGLPFVRWPVTGALAASVVILPYSVLIEGAVLLGLVAAASLVAASAVVGVLLALDGR